MGDLTAMRELETEYILPGNKQTKLSLPLRMEGNFEASFYCLVSNQGPRGLQGT